MARCWFSSATPSPPSLPGYLLMGGGALVTVILASLRASFAWFQLHPIGFTVGSVWLMNELWFSIFLAWLTKSLILRYGGPLVYRKMVPFFLGLVLDCVDGIVFTAGIGENDDVVRRESLKGLDCLGVKIDEKANAHRAKEPMRISAVDSRVAVWVTALEEDGERWVDAAESPQVTATGIPVCLENLSKSRASNSSTSAAARNASALAAWSPAARSVNPSASRATPSHQRARVAAGTERTKARSHTSSESSWASR